MEYVLSADDSPERALELGSTHKCQRGLSCCKRTPPILEDEIKRIETFAENELGITPEELYSKYLEGDIYLGRKLLFPRYLDGRCIFFEEVPRTEEGKIEQSSISKFLKDSVGLRFLGTECYDRLPHDKMGKCIIHEVKPLACGLYTCEIRNLCEWFDYNYIAKGHPSAEAALRKKNIKKQIFVLTWF